MPNPTVSSSESLPTSSRFARPFKGVRQLWTPRSASHSHPYAKETASVAMTLTTDFRACPETQSVTLLHPNLEFLPHCGQLGWNSAKAFVHYEPSQSHVALGANPDMKHSNTLWLTVEQYAWLIQQLQEEKGVHDALKATRSATYSTSSTAITAWGAFIRPFSAPAPVLGVLNAQLCSRTFARRFSRLLYRTKHRSIPEIYRQCIFMLPKSLLLQAAVHIPMTKPLPPLAAPTLPRQVFKEPFQELSADLHNRLRRYGELAAKTAHDIVPEPTDAERTFCKLVCRKCQSLVGLDTAVLSSSLLPTSAISCGISTINVDDNRDTVPAIKVSQPEKFTGEVVDDSRNIPTFALSYLQNIWSPDSCISATEHHERNGSTVSDSNSDGSSPVTSFSLEQKAERRGYIAVDHQNEEIVVVFPGVSSSKALFENASFVPAPWQDTETADDAVIAEEGPKPQRRSISTTFKRRTWTRSTMRPTPTQNMQQQQEDTTFWVLDCALAAWRRCELTVATQLMRTCQVVPAHYRVVIIGHSLGGGKV
ncbi:hypothetical protein DFQ30_003028 [Apophysomyces sp. BC1015]|nr:hypothetical protein DFQ30_003028 [Apophysomyces sp. BC1015]